MLQVRAVLLIAILAIARKLIMLDLATTEAAQLFALALAILSPGAIYGLVREQDRCARIRRARDDAEVPDCPNIYEMWLKQNGSLVGASTATACPVALSGDLTNRSKSMPSGCPLAGLMTICWIAQSSVG